MPKGKGEGAWAERMEVRGGDVGGRGGGGGGERGVGRGSPAAVVVAAGKAKGKGRHVCLRVEAMDGQARYDGEASTGWSVRKGARSGGPGRKGRLRALLLRQQLGAVASGLGLHFVPVKWWCSEWGLSL
jgi:hypothetical protein